MNEQEDQVFRDVQLRIAQARHAFEDRFAGLPAEVKERALKAPKPRKEGWVPDWMEIRTGDALTLKTSGGDCPACGGQGVLTFEPVHHTATGTTFAAYGFSCYLCNFEVSGPDEMAALRKANTPALMPAGLTVSHGRTLTPEEIKSGETQTS